MMDLGDLPPEDRELSPHTGWTRAHWEAAADALLEGVRRHATQHHALLHLSGGRASRSGRLSDGFEGYARTFLLAAFRLGGANGKAPGDLDARYAEGLVVGTDEDGEERWPDVVDVPQARVEAASVAIGLYETRPWIWDRLASAEREGAVAWLSKVHDQPYPANNWFLFQVIVNAFLKSVDAPYRQDEIVRNLDRIDAMYRRDGWYTDGAGHNYDHYIGWAMHLYTILWCRMDGDRSDPARAQMYRQRLRRFLEDFPYLFAADGSPLYQGRSLIYRFAAAAALWAGALADASPLSPGETRRIASGAVQHFLERGALRDGVLTMGWHREFLPMAQTYSGPASPYWASKGFLGLLLPPEHPVWTAREEPMPVERGDFCRAMSEPGFSARGTRADGIVRVANHRSDHFPFLDSGVDPHYCKLSYSTHTAPNIVDGDDGAIDSHVVIIGRDGEPSQRAHIHTIAVADRFAASVYYPKETVVAEGRSLPQWFDRIETVSIARGSAEIRIHHVATLGTRVVRDGGYAIAGETPPECETGETWALARREDGLVTFIAGLHGFSRADTHRLDGANAFGPYSATPYLVSEEPVPTEGVYVSLVVLMAAPFDPESMLREIEGVEVRGRQVEIKCADGEGFFVQLASPDEVDRTLGDVPIRGHVRYARRSPDGSSFVLEV
jgi:hypothetical protein